MDLGCPACFDLFLVENIIRLLMLLWFSCVVFCGFNLRQQISGCFGCICGVD